MTRADDTLAAFFATQELPTYDVRFIAAALVAFERREARKEWMMIALVGMVTLIVAVLVGDRLSISVNALAPALMPVAVVAVVLAFMGQLPGMRRPW